MSEEIKLQNRIDLVNSRMKEITIRLPKINDELGKAAIDDNSNKVDELQDERESLTREREKLQAQLKGLISQKPLAVKADAQVEMNEVELSLSKLMEKSNKSLIDLFEALEIAKKEMDNTVAPEIEANPLIGRKIKLSRLGAHSKLRVSFNLKISSDILNLIDALRLRLSEIEGVRVARLRLKDYI